MIIRDIVRDLTKSFLQLMATFVSSMINCNRVSDELDNCGKLDEKSKTHAMENYAIINMKMVDVYNGLPVEGNY